MDPAVNIPDFLRRPVQVRKEIKLSTTRNDRFMYDNLADLFAIINTTDHLESAYVRDAISAEEYAAACTKLIAQYRTAKEALVEVLGDVKKFMMDFDIQAPAAFNRLEISGVPATLVHGGGPAAADRKQGELYVAAAVQHFITTMDALKLEMRAVDDLHPSLMDLADSLQKVNSIGPDHVAKVKVIYWLTLMNSMRASDELNEDQVRQLLFDLDTAYNAFVKHLEQP